MNEILHIVPLKSKELWDFILECFLGLLIQISAQAYGVTNHCRIEHVQLQLYSKIPKTPISSLVFVVNRHLKCPGVKG